MPEVRSFPPNAIAIVGMSCRAPGASSADAFWRNLVDGVESIRRLTDDELRNAGVPPSLVNNPQYVRAKGVLDDADRFDAALFGFTPREAALIDPQHRVLLECAWEALEHAGHGAPSPTARVGVYAGVGLNTYLLRNLYSDPDLVRGEGEHQLLFSSDKDFAPTRISYQLDLRGPSVNVQTACSTSLVAVHMACQSLLAHQCDMALAGGAAITVPLTEGYLYREGGILSPDGHCRPFDANAQGTVSGNGAGIVVLKRLADAVADGDHVHAVILGSAINNDGADKVGYTAPSVTGQAAVIAEAQALAGTPASSIGYVEAHGTGTPLGDPIEFAALTSVFQQSSHQPGVCAIGSVKSNIGHLDTAAGVVGLIKAVLAVREATIPPSLHYEKPNPALKLATSPFYVAASTAPWQAKDAAPRRAGISAFGIGGTNAHVVIEEAPARGASAASTRSWQILPVSARTPSALNALAAQLAKHLDADGPPLADVAFTLARGRRALRERRAVIARDARTAAAAVVQTNTIWFREGRRTAWLFPGQGAQQIGMGEALAAQEPAFREALDHAAQALLAAGAPDIRQVMWPAERTAAASDALTQTASAQAAIFAIEYAFAALWRSWGAAPAVVIGHSIGEYVAACVAGVLTLEEAARLVVVRGRLMQALPGGAMLAVTLSERDVAPLLTDSLWLSAVNAPERCVVGGTLEAISALEVALATRGVSARRLRTSHAFHTGLMEPMLAAFANEVATIPARPPRLPWISTLTGRMQSESPAGDYWVRQVREPVRFADAIRLVPGDHALLEVGPGDTLTTLARSQVGAGAIVVSSSATRSDDETRTVAAAIAALWSAGVEIDWANYYAHEKRQRVVLPTYPFERQKYWIDAGTAGRGDRALPAKGADLYLPSWEPATALPAQAIGGRWLLLADGRGIGESMAVALRRHGTAVTTVTAEDVDPISVDDYRRILEEARPQHIVHLWSVTGEAPDDPARAGLLGYGSVMALAQALASRTASHDGPVSLTVVADGLHVVTGHESVCAEKALLLGPARVLSQEHPEIACRVVDIDASVLVGERVEQLLAECAAPIDQVIVALRGRLRFTPVYKPADQAPGAIAPRQQGVYLITGGLGALGLTLARHLYETTGAKLVLTGRTVPDETVSAPADDETITIDLGEVADSLEPANPLVDAGVIRALDETLDRSLAIQPFTERGGLATLLDTLCASHVCEYLRACGVDLHSNARYARADLERLTRVQPAYRRFLDFFVDALVTDGIARVDGNAIVFAGPLPAPSETLRARVREEYPEAAPVADAIAHCAERYVDVLSGTADALSVLYPEGGSTWLERAVVSVADHSRHRQYGELVARLLVTAAERRRERPLRILEVGGGNRFLTRQVVPALAGANVEYTFTDISRAFIDRAREWAARDGHHHLRFAQLDISRSSGAQGLHDRFDAVIGLDVVHATPDVIATLGHLRDLLADDGVLHLIETQPPARWNTMVWGLARDWWHYRDEHRTTTPLLDGDQWRSALAAARYSDIGAHQPASGRPDCALIYGRRTAALESSTPAAALSDLRARGADILAIAADVTDADAMADVVSRAIERFGALHGVIHAAGLESSGALTRQSVDPAASDLAAKVRGARALERALHGQPLDFLILCSSITSILGGVGNATYTAANAFLDAFAHERRPRGYPVVSVNWDRWRGVGMAATIEARHLQRTGEEMEGGLAVDRALAMFDRVAGAPLAPQLVASPSDVETLRRHARGANINQLAERIVTNTLHPRPFMATAFVAPQNDLQQRIAAVWEEALGVSAIGIDDDFSELGGDSLIAIKVVSRLRDALAVELKVAALFEAPTVARLAERLERTVGSPRSTLDFIPDAGEAPAPLSFAQERLWFLYQFGGDSGPGAAYNVPAALRIRGPLDVDALTRALDEIVRRHSILRTRFVSHGDRTVQVVDPPSHAGLILEDLTAHDPDSREGEAAAWIEREAARPFDLAKGRLARFTLLRVADAHHLLVAVMHHMVTDGWSMSVLLREACALHEAFTQAQRSPLPALRCQYRDYAAEQRRSLTDDALAPDLEYWKQRMAGVPLLLDLTGDRPRPPEQSYRGGVVRFELSKATTAGLKKVARESDSSLFMVLLAGYAALLRRHTGRQDMVIGTVVAGRDRRDIEDLIGIFSNYVPLRVTVDDRADLAAATRRISKDTLEAFEHHHVPFEKLVDALAPERMVGVPPLFQVALILQNLPRTPSALGAASVEQVSIDRSHAKLDISVLMEEAGDAIRGELEYNADLFDHETARRMATHFALLLDGAVASPAQPLSRVPLLQGEERRRIEQWSGAGQVNDRASLPHLFARQVALSPDAIALVAGQERLTFSELLRRARQLAAHLGAAGVRSESRVGVCLPRSADLIVSILGILEAGAAYVPLDPSHPADRLSTILDDAGVDVVVTHDAFAAKVPRATLVCVDRDAQLIASREPATHAPRIDPDQLAYVIYTSGSTGTPKGVMIEHASVASLVASLRKEVYDGYDRPLQVALVASTVFDASVQQIFGSLLLGHTLHVTEDDSRRDGERLLRFFGDHAIDVADCTPSLLTLLLEAGLGPDPSLPLRHLLVGGEALPVPLIERLHQQDAARRITVTNVYGPTECCVDNTAFTIQPRQSMARSTVPIGAPLASSRVYVLDEHMQPVPVAVAGDIWIGGPAVGRGYLGNAPLTALAFQPSPFADGERIYRTGDRGRWTSAGVIEFLGRGDGQVKVRGHRIELGEIESVLRAHANVKDAAVTASPDLIAYIVPGPQAPTVSQLRDHLAAAVPAYMVPSRFVRVDRLPLNASGKLDRAALPAADRAEELDRGIAYVAPQSAQEQALAAVWSALLGRPSVGLDDNFFALGGDSIKALQVVARLRQAGFKLEIRDLFLHPTVATLAPHVTSTAPASPSRSTGGLVPLGPAQAWFLEQFEGAKHHFLQSLLLEPVHRLDADALAAAVEAIQAHHDALRSRFVLRDDEWIQDCAPIDAISPLEEMDLSGAVDPATELTAAAARVQAGLSLEGPLFKAVLFTLPAGQRLLLAAHHLVVDAVSWRILLEDLETAYRQGRAGGAIALPPRSDSYQAWSSSVHHFAARVPEPERAHWNAVDRADVMRIHVDAPDALARHGDRVEYKMQLDAVRTRALLTDAHAAYNTNVDDLLLTALAGALARWTGGSRFRVLLEGHGRVPLQDGIDVSRTVGWFTARYPVVLDAPGSSDVARRIKIVKEMLRAVPNGGVGYEAVRRLAADRQRDRARVIEAPEIAFNYLGQFGDEIASPLWQWVREDIGAWADPESALPQELECLALVSGGTLQVSFAYSRRRFNASTIAALAASFEQSLVEVIDHAVGIETRQLTPADLDFDGFDVDTLDQFINKL